MWIVALTLGALLVVAALGLVGLYGLLDDERAEREKERKQHAEAADNRAALIAALRRTRRQQEDVIGGCHDVLDGLVLPGELPERVALLVQRVQHAEGLLEGNPVDGGEFLLALAHVQHHATVLVEKINDEGEVKDGHQEVESLVAALQEYAAVFATVESRKREDAENPAHAEEIAARDATIERLHGTIQRANSRERKMLRRLQDPERLARQFHETYERLAPDHGYKTREESAVPWADVPEKNKRLMIATCDAIQTELRRPVVAEAEAVEA